MGSELDDIGRVLHERLLAGDELATSEIAELFILPLVNALNRGFRGLPDPHLVTTAVNDALLGYFSRPDRFDPDRLGLFSYLRMAAQGDLQNSLRRSKLVELTAPDSEHALEGLKDPADLEASMVKRDSPLLREVNELLTDPMDRRFLGLMMEGVRETSEYAQLLGISDRPVSEQTALVKRHKDRLKKTLQRKMKRVGDG